MAVAVVANGQRIIVIDLNCLQALTADSLGVQLESLNVVQADDLGRQNNEVTQNFLFVGNGPHFLIDQLVIGEVIKVDNLLLEDERAIAVSGS